MSNQVKVPGPKVLLIGPSGSGKTYSIRTLVEAGLEVFVLFVEPGQEILADIPPEKLHWHYLQPKTQTWAEMLAGATLIQKMSVEALTKVVDPSKGKEAGFINLLTSLADFPDDRTGKKYGAVDSWGPDRVLVIDSLSGLNTMAMSTVVGNKLTPSPGEWGGAMKLIEGLVNQLVTACTCPVVIIGHVERETDEITGGVKLMVSTLGRKLAPILPKYFSETIFAKRTVEAGKEQYFWSNAETNVDTKRRLLPFGDKIAPTFVPLINKWRELCQ